jgi:hypothetical protein
LSDSCGQSRALTLLTPVSDEAGLKAALAGLPEGDESPLARLPGTHFARWVVMPGSRLLFSATHDRAVPDYVEQIARLIPDEADRVWGHCDGYPGAADPATFVGYMDKHRIRTNLFVSAYPHADLAEVREGLDLRARLGGFAPRAQSMGPEELRAAFAEAGLG